MRLVGTLDLCPLSRRLAHISNGVLNPTSFSLHPNTNHTRWDGGPEVMSKLLSVRLAHHDDFDVNYHSFPGDLMWSWRGVDAWGNPHQCRTRRRPFMTRGLTRADLVHDSPMGLECTQVYLIPFEASTQSGMFQPHHQKDKSGSRAQRPRSSPWNPTRARLPFSSR